MPDKNENTMCNQMKYRTKVVLMSACPPASESSYASAELGVCAQVQLPQIISPSFHVRDSSSRKFLRFFSFSQKRTTYGATLISNDENDWFVRDEGGARLRYARPLSSSSPSTLRPVHETSDKLFKHSHKKPSCGRSVGCCAWKHGILDNNMSDVFIGHHPRT